ncbi:MAG: RNA polymerase subunit sigma-70 [Thalassobius sp.]|nr:RNA polymerase subunit sigma-70 [Thalassovita sp.]|tara:strand:+ start:89 stop:601 length:513 start_codon:yes stop_codon:yes gene_type:complete
MKTNKTEEIVQIIEQNKGLIYKVVNAYCSDVHEQEDLTQEIILQIIKAYEKFDYKVKVTTWMYRIALNVSISQYRKIKSRQKYILPMPENLVKVADDSVCEENEELVQLKAFIQELPPLNRAILIMFLDGNNHTEISEAVGISVSNVGTKISRIKQQLKKKFNQQKNELR